MVRVVNLVVGALTSIAVLVTIVSAFVFPCGHLNGLNVFFAVVTVLICGGHFLLTIWYLLGGLGPAFSCLIFFNAVTIILLCVCGNMYIRAVGTSSGAQQGTTTPNLVTLWSTNPLIDHNQSSTVG